MDYDTFMAQAFPELLEPLSLFEDTGHELGGMWSFGPFICRKCFAMCVEAYISVGIEFPCSHCGEVSLRAIERDTWNEWMKEEDQ